MGQIILFHIAAPPGVYQVIHAETVDFFLFNEVQDFRQILFIQIGQGKPDAGPVAGSFRRPDSSHGGGEGSPFAAKFVMHRLAAVKADADILEAGLPD